MPARRAKVHGDVAGAAICLVPGSNGARRGPIGAILQGHSGPMDGPRPTPRRRAPPGTYEIYLPRSADVLPGERPAPPTTAPRGHGERVLYMARRGRARMAVDARG
jgi:hypothetical protein